MTKTEVKLLTVPDPYAELGLAETATEADIKQAYFAQVRAHPPETDSQGFKRIRAAYERLRTPEKRLETDMPAPGQMARACIRIAGGRLGAEAHPGLNRCAPGRARPE